jgi:hypothetical protein
MIFNKRSRSTALGGSHQSECEYEKVIIEPKDLPSLKRNLSVYYNLDMSYLPYTMEWFAPQIMNISKRPEFGESKRRDRFRHYRYELKDEFMENEPGSMTFHLIESILDHLDWLFKLCEEKKGEIYDSWESKGGETQFYGGSNKPPVRLTALEAYSAVYSKEMLTEISRNNEAHEG